MEHHPRTEHAVTSSDQTGTQQYLTFMLAGEEYGVNILRVQEIRGWGTVTVIPNVPAFVLGVVNLRGTIVPIVDLRKRFGIPNVDYGNTTVVIVLKVNSRRGETTMGFVVDAVSDVYNLSTQQLHAAPDFGTTVSFEFIDSLAAVDDKMVILLNIDQLIDAESIPVSDGKLH